MLKRNDGEQSGKHPDRGGSSFGSAPAWLTLAVGLSFTALLSSELVQLRKDGATQQFDLHVKELVAAIEKRLHDHEQILLGAAGWIDASQELPSRQQWKIYVESLNLAGRYPGIQGVGFTKVIAPADLEEHVAAIKAEGFPDYHVRPAGARDLYTSIIYLEPFVGRNLAAFGFDMYSEPTRREGMQRAVSSDSTAITNKVKLVQETHGKEQAGFLMYLPVYRPLMPIETVEQRWQALLGFVYSPYRVGDLMLGILGKRVEVLDFTLHDGETLGTETLMYDSAVESDDALGPDPALHATSQIEAYGNVWTFSLRSRPAFQEQFESPLDWLIPLLGASVSISLFALIWSLQGRRERAQALAEEISPRRIAENRQADEAMQEQAQHTQTILDNIVDAIITVDGGGIIQSVNTAAGEIFGYTDTDMLGCNVGILVSQEHREVFDNFLHGFSQSRSAQAIGIDREIDGQRRGGDLFPIELAISEFARQGRPHYVVMVRDISERKRIERMKAEFISTVSHELRTPLTSITGALALVMGGVLGEVPEKMADLLRVAHKNSQRLHLLINDLLDMEKLVAGQMRFDLQPQQLTPLLERAVKDNRSYADQLGVTLELDTSGPDCAVSVDAHRLQQVLSNLLSNAAKFSPKGGVVSVSVQRHESAVRVQVGDQGPGIPAEFHARIFQKFAQADSTDSRQKGGTGLGLAITRELVERMNGTVGFDSIEGLGTTFWFELTIGDPTQ